LHVPRIILSHSLLGDIPGVFSVSAENLGSELHHLRRVLRVKSGDRIEILDTNSPNIALGAIESLQEHELVLAIHDKIIRSSPPKIVLALGFPTPQILDLVVEKATELEVSEIALFFAMNSQSADRIEKLEKRFERLERIRDSARMQSGSRKNLNIKIFDSLETLLVTEKAASLKLLFSLAEDAPNLLAFLAKKTSIEKLEGPADALLVIGPEGGLRDEEEELALANGVEKVSLGGSVLRVATAAVSAVASVKLFLECSSEAKNSLGRLSLDALPKV